MAIRSLLDQKIIHLRFNLGIPLIKIVNCSWYCLIYILMVLSSLTVKRSCSIFLTSGFLFFFNVPRFSKLKGTLPSASFVINSIVFVTIKLRCILEATKKKKKRNEKLRDHVSSDRSVNRNKS